jgi:hypothetical protein
MEGNAREVKAERRPQGSPPFHIICGANARRPQGSPPFHIICGANARRPQGSPPFHIILPRLYYDDEMASQVCSCHQQRPHTRATKAIPQKSSPTNSFSTFTHNSSYSSTLITPACKRNRLISYSSLGGCLCMREDLYSYCFRNHRFYHKRLIPKMIGQSSNGEGVQFLFERWS